MKNLMILGMAFGLTLAATDRASAQVSKGKVWAGSCTPKVGDDVELAIHTPQNNDPSIGQKSGVKYVFATVIQGGERAGKSIKGGRRTTVSYEGDQKQLKAVVTSLGAKDGAKVTMAKIIKVGGSFKLERNDEVSWAGDLSKEVTYSVSRKGKALGSFTIKQG